MRYLASLLLSALSLAAHADPASERKALFFGRDDRVAISAPYPAPYAAIGQLETRAASTCTATLVAPDLAVTAAHCFLMDKGKIDPGQWFKAGFHKGKYQARYRVVDQVFHPKFRAGLVYKGDDVYIEPSAARYDIAWIKLERADGAAPAPIPLFKGDRQTLTTALKDAAYRATQAGFAEDHDDILTAHQGCQITKFRSNNTLYHRCDTLSGDSGSPLFIDTQYGPQLIAVQSSAPDWFNRKKADNVAVTVLQLPERP
ncbi:trypsin-like serine peptidase [Jeongeupia naejangsanensis]|uniref:Trypsin-like serine protease n=1 Tax=Jeongeupia naejangsanensis TaxID=613195 RepID=A0ABS2BPY2_9NEIS|nr:trypsin-like serine protease [Jeongeupia naejangsanensis]MBM3117628.1 trypsin-like serine protease [Jeongeupia naejangsanensis]